MSQIASTTPRRGRRTATFVGAGVAVLAVAATIPGAGASVGVGEASAVLTVIVGTILALVGFARRGMFLTVAAVTLALGGWGAAESPDQILRGIAIAATPIAFASAALSLSGRSPVGRSLVVGGAAIAGPIRALVDDPFRDASCVGCGHNALAVFRDPDVAREVAALGWIVIALGAVLLVWKATMPILMVGVAIAALAGIAEMRSGAETAATLACLVSSLGAVITVAAGLNVRRRLSRLASIPAGDQVSAALREIVGDGQFQID